MLALEAYPRDSKKNPKQKVTSSNIGSSDLSSQWNILSLSHSDPACDCGAFKTLVIC